MEYLILIVNIQINNIIKKDIFCFRQIQFKVINGYGSFPFLSQQTASVSENH